MILRRGFIIPYETEKVKCFLSRKGRGGAHKIESLVRLLRLYFCNSIKKLIFFKKRLDKTTSA